MPTLPPSAESSVFSPAPSLDFVLDSSLDSACLESTPLNSACLESTPLKPRALQDSKDSIAKDSSPQNFIPQDFIPSDFIPMYASEAEINLFAKHIANSRFYLEFGAGGSTFLACSISQAQIISVESDLDFIKQLSANALIAKALQSARLKFTHINLGKVQKWGFPAQDCDASLFPLYAKSIFQAQDSTSLSRIDTIFIDGRFRVACALNAILHCPQALILIHDFFDRAQYHILLDFLDCVEKTQNLGVFQPKPKPNVQKILSLIEQYQFEPL